MSALPVSLFDTASISTPTGLRHVTVALTYEADRMHTFDIEVGYNPDDVAVVTMQLRTLSTALDNPGQQVYEGRVVVTFDAIHDIVMLNLPMGGGRALLQLPASSALEFAQAASAEASDKWHAALEVDAAAERVVSALADNGFHALDAWLTNQG